MTAQDLYSLSGKYKLRVEDYILLDQAGTFKGNRTELIEGDIILMSPQYRPHMFIKDELAFTLRIALQNVGRKLHVGTAGSVALSDNSLPQPDIILTSQPRGEGPVPADSVALLIEVSDTTVDDDVGPKAIVYACASVPEYWVVNVNARTIHQM